MAARRIPVAAGGHRAARARWRVASLGGALLPLLLAAALSLLVAAPVAAQEPPSADDSLDVDGLFEGDGGGEENGDGDGGGGDAAAGDDADADDEAEGGADDGAPVLDRLTEREPIDFRASVRFTGGYSPGWTAPLGASGGEYDDLPVAELSSGLDLRLNVSPALSITQKFLFEYPDYDFEVTELALDYTAADVVFLTLGLKRINWGRSPNFALANLPQRQAESPLGPDESENTILARATVPIGIGGIELLAQNKSEYQEDPDSPRADRVGVGVKYNWARERLDLDVGAYYQAGLAGRLFVSGQTTLTDRIELYSEGVMADERLRADDTVPADADPGNNPDFGAAVGVVVGLFENSLDLNAEYYYSGEETEREVEGARFPLFHGHNLAFNADYRIPHAPFRLRLAYRYSENLDSSFLAPRLTVDAMRHLTVDLFAGFLWGPEDAGYRAENPDDANRPLFGGITFTLHGEIK